jgi:hypothetical protein
MRWPLHIAGLIVYISALWAAVCAARCSKRNGISWGVLVAWLASTVGFYIWLIVRTVVFGPTQDPDAIVIWVANAIQLQGGIAAAIIFWRKWRHG